MARARSSAGCMVGRQRGDGVVPRSARARAAPQSDEQRAASGQRGRSGDESRDRWGASGPGRRRDAKCLAAAAAGDEREHCDDQEAEAVDRRYICALARAGRGAAPRTSISKTGGGPRPPPAECSGLTTSARRWSQAPWRLSWRPWRARRPEAGPGPSRKVAVLAHRLVGGVLVDELLEAGDHADVLLLEVDEERTRAP